MQEEVANDFYVSTSVGHIGRDRSGLFFRLGGFFGVHPTREYDSSRFVLDIGMASIEV